MMTEIMRPPTEEETAMMMSLMEEMMQMPSDEQMAEMEQGKLIKYSGIYFIFITLALCRRSGLNPSSLVIGIFFHEPSSVSLRCRGMIVPQIFV